MSAVARVTEIIASSTKSFEEAVQIGVQRATKTLDNVAAAWVKEQQVKIENDAITEYRVTLKVTFVLKE